MFVGAFERTIDDKGRLALPASFRDRLGGHCYLVKGLDKCVSVIPADVFEREADRIEAQEAAGEITRNESRAWFASATEVNLDKQGRMVIEEHLRSYAGLVPSSTATVAGHRTRLEIWSPERFARIDEAGTDLLAGDEA